MKIYELIIISFSLGMDAFSVSICKGLQLNKNIRKYSLIIALSFSFFQMLMPLSGYFLGNILNNYFLKFNKLIAFILLFIVAVNMIKESFENNNLSNTLTLKELLILSIATSIDAFSIGLTFSLFKVNLILAIFIIGIITFILCFIGVLIGKIIGNKFEKISEVFGGLVLIIMSLKFLLEHFKIF